MLQTAKNKNNSPKPNIRTALSKYFVTIKDNIQTKVDTSAVALDLTFAENNSESITHGKGPYPMLKNRINVVRLMTGRSDNASRSKL